MEYFNVYNKFGEKTGEIVERNEAHRKGICHRVIHLWLINARDEILIQQNSPEDETAPNIWYVSVGGHIISTDSVEMALIRETQEELGLDISHLTDSIKYLYTFKERVVLNNGTYIDDEIFDVFALKFDFKLDQITMQAEEVQAVKFISYDEFKRLIISKDATFWQHDIGYKMLLAGLDDFFARKDTVRITS